MKNEYDGKQAKALNDRLKKEFEKSVKKDIEKKQKDKK